MLFNPEIKLLIVIESMTNGPNKNYHLAKAYLKLLWIIASLILVGVIMLFISENKLTPIDTQENFFCGTQSPLDIRDSVIRAEVYHGKNLFKKKCAQCHNKNMRDNLTGPPLKNTFSLWNNDTAAYVSFVTQSDEYMRLNNNIRLKNSEYQLINIHNNELSQKDVLNILSYIERH